MNKVVIGITGPIASGKHIAIKELEKMGFKTFFLGDRTREEANRRGLSHDRSILQDMGNNLREKLGDDVLVKITEKFITPSDKKIVIDGIRSEGEIKYLRKKYKAFIIGVNAPVEVRKKLSRRRHGDADPKTDEEFEFTERRDRGIGEGSHGQQVEKCLRLSDVVIENDGGESDLRIKIVKILGKLIHQ